MLASAVASNAAALGLMGSLGVLVPALRDEFDVGVGAALAVASVAGGSHLLLGAVVGPAAERFGTPTVQRAGAVAILLAALVAAGADSMAVLVLGFAPLVGLGVTATTMPSAAEVTVRYRERAGRAAGICSAGGAFGAAVGPVLCARSLDALGLRPTLVLAGLAASAVTAVASFFVGHAVAHAEEQVETPRPKRAFRVLYGAAVLSAFGLPLPQMLLVPYAVDRGISVASAAVLLSVYGWASLGGRLWLSRVADRTGPTRALRRITASLALGMLVWPFVGSVPGLVAVAVVLGLCCGACIAMLPVVVMEHMGAGRVRSSFGTLLSGYALGALTGPPLAGALADRTDSYAVSLAVGGLAVAASAAVLLLLRESRTAAALRVTSAEAALPIGPV